MSFQLESTYMDLKCSNVTINTALPMAEPFDTLIPGIPLDSLDQGANGTWRRPCTEGNSTDGAKVCKSYTAPWFLSVDRFVDLYWQNHTMYSRQFTPAALVGEENLDVRETNLLFYTAVYHVKPTLRRETFSGTCQVFQTYVESRVNCTRAVDARSTSPNCAGVDQRISHLLHPSEHISFLSFPAIFTEIAKKLPALGGYDSPYDLDLALHYMLNSNSFLEESRSRNGYNFNMSEVSEQDFGKRLIQLLNTYVGATQLKMDAPLVGRKASTCSALGGRTTLSGSHEGFEFRSGALVWDAAEGEDLDVQQQCLLRLNERSRDILTVVFQ